MIIKKISVSILVFILTACSSVEQPEVKNKNPNKQSVVMSDSYKSGRYYTQYQAVNLTGCRSEDIVNVALSQVGYTAGTSIEDLSGNPTEAGTFSEPIYAFSSGKKAQGAWCSEFVWWCAALAGIPETEFPKCGSGDDYINSNLIDYHPLSDILADSFIPQCGDVILLTNAKNTSPTHSGLIKSWTAKNNGAAEIHTVEGNVSNKVVERTYILNAAGELNLKNGYLCGAGRPSYTNTKK
jgi:hypothetical protein